MKLATLALALGLASPAFAAAPLSVDFEKNWNFGEEVANTYTGVSFTNVLGLSNDANFSYFSGAPSPLGVAFVQLDGITNTAAYMNVAGGVSGGLSFYASTTADFQVKAYSGLNGSGTLLGTFTVAANTTDYSVWTQKVFSFNGVAQSFDLTGANGVAALDNISAVPEPSSVALMLAGATVLLARRRR
ncbi:MAG TPA: PEP-CTERM sorting domain-containing protein [Roseateles sp.]